MYDSVKIYDENGNYKIYNCTEPNRPMTSQEITEAIEKELDIQNNIGGK